MISTGTASDKERVLFQAITLVTGSQALGDDTSDSAQLFATASLSATLLTWCVNYAAAQDAASNGRFEAARQDALRPSRSEVRVGYQLSRLRRGIWAGSRTPKASTKPFVISTG